MRIVKSSGGEATRQALIEASYRLFTSRGYHATTMRDIAADAGITAGSIYNHFADKDQMIKEVLLVYHPIMKVLPVLQKVEGQSVTALIHDSARRMIEAIDASPGILNLMYIELVELNGRHMETLMSSMFPVVQGFLAKIYSQDAKIRPQDPLVFFRLFVGMLLGYSLTRAAIANAPNKQGQTAPLTDFIHVFLYGVLES